jgi:CelD/BcsL family acetyltransferase involved in cellulose biosynthesis
MREYSLEIIENISLFERLEKEWDSLFRESKAASIFQSFEWQRSWWRYYGEGNPNLALHIILVRSGNRLVAIAPFFLENLSICGLLKFSRLAFLGDEVSDYLDILIAPGFEKDCVHHIAQHLEDCVPRINVIHLQDIPERSGMHGLLYEALICQGFRGESSVSSVCPRVRLGETWQATLKTFSSHRRKNIRNRFNSLNKNYDVQFELIHREEDLPQAMDDLITLHQQKWREVGFRGAFSEPRAVDFHRSVARLFLERDWLQLSFLRLNGRRVAASYAFRFRNEMGDYQGGVEDSEETKRYSPGLVLVLLCMEEANRCGMEIYDFLRGGENYKYELGGVDSCNWALLLFSNWKTVEYKYRLVQLIRMIKRRLPERYLRLKRALSKQIRFKLWRSRTDAQLQRRG